MARGSTVRRATAAAAASILAAGVGTWSTPPASAADPPPWERVVGGATGNPVVVASTDGTHTDAFVRAGSAVFHQRATTTTGVRQDLGGITHLDPAAASTPDASYVFVTGIDGAVYYRSIDESTAEPGPWTNLGGISLRAPAVDAEVNGLLHVFVVGVDRAVWTRHQVAGGSWSAWASLGGIVTTDLALDVTFDGPPEVNIVVIALAVRGADGALWTRLSYGGTWGPFVRVGGRVVGSPAVHDGEYAVRGTDNQVYLTSGGDFFATGGFITGDPTMSDGLGLFYEQFTVYGRGPDGAVYYEAWGRGRTNWVRVAADISSRVAAARSDPFVVCSGMCLGLRLYVTAPDGALYTLFS